MHGEEGNPSREKEQASRKVKEIKQSSQKPKKEHFQKTRGRVEMSNASERSPRDPEIGSISRGDGKWAI